MPPEQPAPSTVTEPITDLTDPRVITLLTTEHWSLLTARSLAYNEAFTRGGMFLTFLSMSFVALALFSSAMSFGDAFLTVAAVVLAFDVVLGLATYVRTAGANVDDLRALHGIARIRHGNTQIALIVELYFTTATHDDVDSAITAYGTLPSSGTGTVLYGLTTLRCMIGSITSMVGGVLPRCSDCRAPPRIDASGSASAAACSCPSALVLSTDTLDRGPVIPTTSLLSSRRGEVEWS